MPELRKNIITREWVIIATERGKRPSDFKKPAAAVKSPADQEEERKKCAFCPGNEHLTPPEVFAYRSPGDGNGPWRVRVIPNKFPALAAEGNRDHRHTGLYDMMNGVGIHDVIIETSDHFLDLPFMPQDQIEQIIKAFHERYLQLEGLPHLEHAIIFRNHGEKAGTSLAHPHCQLIGTPVMPKEFWHEVKGASAYYEYEERCPYCHILEFEIQQKERLVWENDSFVAFTAFAGRYPFETWIVPRIHHASLADMTPYQGRDLAQMVKEVLGRLSHCLDDPSYNMTLNSLLRPERYADSFHWHVKVIPRLTTPAGFELGTGMYINVTAPEQAAGFLREAASQAPVEA